MRERKARQKKLDAIVQAAASEVARTIAGTSSPNRLHWFHSVSESNPRDLSIWFVFPTDAAFEQAVASGLAARIDAMTREEMRQGGYTLAMIEDVFVGFKTHEAMKREAGENYATLFQLKSPAEPLRPFSPGAPTSGKRAS
jgi:hypothetical protein